MADWVSQTGRVKDRQDVWLKAGPKRRALAGLGLGKCIGPGLELWLDLGLAHSSAFFVASLFHNNELFVAIEVKLP